VTYGKNATNITNTTNSTNKIPTAKFQEPRDKFQTNPKIQVPKLTFKLEFGAWSLFGSWYLVLGPCTIW
jgi:hypothetical protein